MAHEPYGQGTWTDSLMERHRPANSGCWGWATPEDHDAQHWADRSTSVRRALRHWRAAHPGDADGHALLRRLVGAFEHHRGSLASEQLQNRLRRDVPELYARAVSSCGPRRWHRFVEAAEPVLGLASAKSRWENGEPVWRIYLACRDAAVFEAVDARHRWMWENEEHGLLGADALATVLRT